MSEAKVLATLAVGLPRGTMMTLRRPRAEDAAAHWSWTLFVIVLLAPFGKPMAGRKEDRVVNIEGLREFESDQRALARNGLPQPPSDLSLARARPRGPLRLPAQPSPDHDFVRNIRHGG